MARERDLLTSAFRRALAAWDDEALVDLASKGLLRRAAKDAEGGKVKLTGATPETANFEVEGFQVSLPDAGPQAAQCGCPASGTCRHILAAVLSLRHSGEADPPPLEGPGVAADEAAEDPAGDPIAEILALDFAALAKWAGKPATRAALELLGDAPEFEVIPGKNLALRFPGLDLECRYIPGGGPEGMVSKVAQRRRKAVHLAALLALKQSHGQEIAPVDDAPAKPVAEALNDRERTFVRTVQRLLNDMIDAGLSHLSSGTEQRLSTIAVSARGESLPRLSAQLRAMSSEVLALRHRRADADEGRLFAALCRCHALTTALLSADTADLPPLRGAVRDLYHPAGRLSLFGAGAYRWQTRSGSQGLTVLLLCPATKAWYSCSLSRTGEHDSLFDPVQAYGYQRLWAGTGAPDKVSQAHVVLDGAKLSPAGRLSLASETKGSLEPGPTLAEFRAGTEIFDDWSSVAERLSEFLPAGLGLPAQRQPYLILAPAKWGARDFDPVAQRFSWRLHDAAGRSLALQVDYSPVTEARIDRLERMNPKGEKVWGVVVAAQERATEVVLEPLCLLGRGSADRLTVISPDFPSAGAPRRGALRDTLLARVKDRLRQHATPGVPPAAAAPLTGTARRLAPLGDRLQGLAETGQSILGPALKEEFQEIASALKQGGLDLLAEHVAAFAETERIEPAALTRINYLVLTAQDLDRALPLRPQG